MKKLNFENFLENEYKKIKTRNSRFSKAAFAKKIGISPTHLSQLLNKKRSLTYSVLAKIERTFDLDNKTKEMIIHEIENYKIKRPDKKKEKKIERYKLSGYEQSLVCSWEYMAILSLAEIKGNSHEPNWIAKRLNIDLKKAKDILTCLTKLQLIRINKKGFSLNLGHIQTTDGIPSHYIQDYHKRAIENTLTKIKKVPVDERVFSTLTMPTNLKNTKKIHKAINSFKDKIGDIASKGSKYDRVYQLSIQYVPLD